MFSKFHGEVVGRNQQSRWSQSRIQATVDQNFELYHQNDKKMHIIVVFVRLVSFVKPALFNINRITSYDNVAVVERFHISGVGFGLGLCRTWIFFCLQEGPRCPSATRCSS